eukprot:4323030-Prymnesium_polylepis.1
MPSFWGDPIKHWSRRGDRPRNPAANESRTSTTAGGRSYSVQRRETAGGSKLSNRRGDTQSKAALLHSIVCLRLCRLVTLVVDKKLTSVSWPVWGAELRKIRERSDQVRTRALFRIPATYRDSVKFFVSLTTCCDTFVLSAMAGRLIKVCAKRVQCEIRV